MRSHCKLFILLLLSSTKAGTTQASGGAVIPVQAPHAMVASVHRLASRAGVQMMKAGGNAVDAAIAVGFALAVVHPQAGNLGGGGFMLVRMADGKTHFVDYREKAPAAATANMYLDAQGNVIEDASIVGYKAIGVPGSVAGMVYAEKKYGKLPLERVMAPAIKLAEDGFVLAAEDARDLREDKPLGQFPESRRIFQRNGNFYQADEVLKQPDLARTLMRIARDPDDFYHGALALEAFRRAFFDLAEFLGDPDFSKIPVAQLIDKRYGAAWRQSIDPAHAGISKGLRRPAIFSQLEQYATLHAEPVAVAEPDHTTHYSVVDPDGNAVAVTTTLNDSFGSRVTAEGLGFLLNDEMDDFAAKQGIPNIYGLIQGPANAIAPGKRPLSAMTPTIVLKDGKLFLILGSPGGPRIITIVTNILIDIVDFSLDIAEAVNAPRFHNPWLPDQIPVEDRLSPDTMNVLRSKGHKLDVEHFWGDGECIMVDPKTGESLGASDGRNNGKAVGY